MARTGDTPVEPSCPIPDVRPLLEPAHAVAPPQTSSQQDARRLTDPGCTAGGSTQGGADELSAGLDHLVQPGLVYAG